jgi:hypothetical protein
VIVDTVGAVGVRKKTNAVSSRLSPDPALIVTVLVSVLIAEFDALLPLTNVYAIS